MGYAQYFNNPIGKNAFVENLPTVLKDKNTSDLIMNYVDDISFYAQALLEQDHRQNARQNSLETFLAQQAVLRNKIIYYIDQKALTSFIAHYFLESGWLNTTRILDRGFSQYNRNFLPDNDKKIIEDYGRYWAKEINDSRRINQPIVLLHIRYSTTANSEQNIPGAVVKKFQDTLQGLGYIVWCIFSDGRTKGSYAGIKKTEFLHLVHH